MDGNIVSANTKNVHKFALQQKARSILYVVVIVVPVFIGAAAYIAYTDMTGSQDEANLAEGTTAPISQEAIDQSNASASSQPATTEITPPAPPSVETPSQSPAGSSPSTRAQSSPLPKGLVTALNSIEANGIKGSAYVSASFDTSNIPDGTSISFNRETWLPESETAGTIKGTVSVYGQPQNGSVRFAESGGIWRATGYSLN